MFSLLIYLHFNANSNHVCVSAASCSATVSLLTNTALYLRFLQPSARLTHTDLDDLRIWSVKNISPSFRAFSTSQISPLQIQTPTYKPLNPSHYLSFLFLFLRPSSLLFHPSSFVPLASFPCPSSLPSLVLSLSPVLPSLFNPFYIRSMIHTKILKVPDVWKKESQSLLHQVNDSHD